MRLFLLSCILNPNNKFDVFEKDEVFEEVKEIVGNKVKEMKEEQRAKSVIEGRTNRSNPTSELINYIAEECTENASLEEIVNYWYSNRNKYKILFKMSQQFLYLIASSTTSERLFSNASGFYTVKRTLLTPSHLEQSCIVHSWLINEGFDIFENMKFESK